MKIKKHRGITQPHSQRYDGAGLKADAAGWWESREKERRKGRPGILRTHSLGCMPLARCQPADVSQTCQKVRAENDGA